MARTRTLHGKRAGWSVKLSQPKSDAADAMRGTMLRAHWLESLIDAALPGGVTPGAAPAPPPPEVAAEAVVPPERGRKRRTAAAETSPVEAVRALAEASGVPLVTASQIAPKRKRCPHPGTRITGGYCKECDHLIESGGYWRES